MTKYNIYTYSDNNFIICKYTNIDFLINKSGIRNIISIIITTRNINDACIFLKKYYVRIVTVMSALLFLFTVEKT